MGRCGQKDRNVAKVINRCFTDKTHQREAESLIEELSGSQDKVELHGGTLHVCYSFSPTLTQGLVLNQCLFDL